MSGVDEPSKSPGEKALDELQLCVIERRSPPDWALREIVRCWRFFKEGVYPGGLVQTPDQQPAIQMLVGDSLADPIYPDPRTEPDDHKRTKGPQTVVCILTGADEQKVLRLERRAGKLAPAPRSLGAAFGVADHKGGQMSTKALKAQAVPRMLALFVPHGSIPRSTEGEKEVAKQLGLTKDQVHRWLPREGK